MNFGLSTVFIPKGIHPRPQEFEISCSVILSQYFKARVDFVKRSPIHTSDIKINNRIWEIKSPVGDGKRTIQNNLRKADDQSENVVLDLRRCSLRTDRAIGRAKAELKKATKIKRLLVVTKSEKVIVIYGKI